MTGTYVAGISEPSASRVSEPNSRTQAPSYFILTVLGFSFWFFLVVPFASHRETYSWLAGVPTHSLAQEFSYGLSSTYRPLAQVATWFGFRILNPSIFPTDPLRQALLQGFVYGMFVLAWWFIYSAAPNRRLLALIAFITGGVFFSGYVHLFHLYGMFYVPVVLTLGVLLHLHASGTFQKREVWFAFVATALALWHPFATALFVGFYFGFYLETFRQRSRAQHIQAAAIVLIGVTATFVLVFLFPRAHMPVESKLLGFLVSYRTNEVNSVASFVAFLLAQIALFGTELSPRLKLAASLFVLALSIVFFLKSLPLLLGWFCVVLLKLFLLRRWSLFFLMLTAALLPFGGGIGTPIYALFGIIVAVYATALGWAHAERALSLVKARYVTGMVVALAALLVMVRVGVRVPVLARVATPLLAERERTYQLEDILAWLHNSSYCGYEIAFTDNAGNPIEDVESAITRRNRPPAGIDDVRLFWKTALQCQSASSFQGEPKTVLITFGGQALADSMPAFKIPGKYAGDATVWIQDPRK